MDLRPQAWTSSIAEDLGIGRGGGKNKHIQKSGVDVKMTITTKKRKNCKEIRRNLCVHE